MLHCPLGPFFAAAMSSSDTSDWLGDVDFKEDLGEAPINPLGIIIASGMVIRTYEEGVAHPAKMGSRGISSSSSIAHPHSRSAKATAAAKAKKAASKSARAKAKEKAKAKDKAAAKAATKRG